MAEDDQDERPKLPEPPEGFRWQRQRDKPDWFLRRIPGEPTAPAGAPEGVPEVQAPERPKDWGAGGQINRGKIADELREKPWLHERLNMMIRGEVGDRAPPEVRRIQMETAMNRALDRGHSLEQALWDTGNHGNRGYYPRQTFSRGGFDRDTYAADLKAVLAGSNYGGKYMPPGKMVTGNASDEPGNRVASHQFARGTPGFTMQTGSGPESYFSEGAGKRRTADLPQVEDMSEHYNTPLTESEIPQFKAWAKGQSAIVGRDVMKDKFDYDVQGAWKENHSLSLEHHGSDRFKKPNHPTFSSESMYSRQQTGNPASFEGGHWFMEGNRWNFMPSEHNVRTHSQEGLEAYFGSDAEKGSVLRVRPEGTSKAMQESMSDWTGSIPMHLGELSSQASKNIEYRPKHEIGPISRSAPPRKGLLVDTSDKMTDELGFNDANRLFKRVKQRREARAR